MTIPGKTWKDQRRKRQGRLVRTNPTPKQVRDREKFWRNHERMFGNAHTNR